MWTGDAGDRAPEKEARVWPGRRSTWLGRRRESLEREGSRPPGRAPGRTHAQPRAVSPSPPFPSALGAAGQTSPSSALSCSSARTSSPASVVKSSGAHSPAAPNSAPNRSARARAALSSASGEVPPPAASAADDGAEEEVDGWTSDASDVARIDGRPHAVMCSNHGRGSSVRLSAKPCVVSRWRMWMPIDETFTQGGRGGVSGMAWGGRAKGGGRRTLVSAAGNTPTCPSGWGANTGWPARASTKARSTRWTLST